MCHAQGRARPSLAQLYRWRYEGLGDLPNVLTGQEYLRANPGFAFDYQFIDVPDYQGRGESTPVPYFYQVRWPFWQYSTLSGGSAACPRQP